jgi:hypothetical protein
VGFVSGAAGEGGAVGGRAGGISSIRSEARKAGGGGNGTCSRNGLTRSPEAGSIGLKPRAGRGAGKGSGSVCGTALVAPRTDSSVTFAALPDLGLPAFSGGDAGRLSCSSEVVELAGDPV